MWDDDTASSSSRQLSEYERQRLENIAEMSEQFSDLFENVTKSALDLAKSTSSSSNGPKRTRNSKQISRAKMFSNVQISPPRRSKRLINEKRTKPEYNEESDSDDEKPSKALRLKFPFFKNREFAQRDEDYYRKLDDSDFIDSDDELMEYDGSRRHRKTSINTYQVPVSAITESMLKNITYSSCGKKYDALKGTTCHQCRQKTLDQKSYCRYKKCRGIRGMFCGFCLGKRYGEDVAEVLMNKKWACPPCRGYCNCSICRRKRGKTPTGQLSQIALAGGYKSVKHMLENTEGSVTKELSSDYDSDDDKNDNQENPKNDNQEDQKDPRSESIDNNLNDVSPPKKKFKTDHLNEELVRTEQKDNLVITEDKNVPNDVNCYYVSDEDNKKSDQENSISESINHNNLNDNEIQSNVVIFKKKPKTYKFKKETLKTEQNDSLVETEKKNVEDNVNCFSGSEEQNFLETTSGEMILDRLYQQLFCF